MKVYVLSFLNTYLVKGFTDNDVEWEIKKVFRNRDKARKFALASGKTFNIDSYEVE